MSLQRLATDEFIDMFAGFSTAESLYAVLDSTDEVKNARRELQLEANGRERVESFVSKVLRDFRTGTILHRDVSLAALATALDRIPGQWVDKFLKDLAALHIAEIPLSRRVAALALKVRPMFVHGSTHRDLVISPIATRIEIMQSALPQVA